MFRSYLKTAWRSLWKHKGHTVVNLVGFAMGMALNKCLSRASIPMTRAHRRHGVPGI